LATTAQKFLAEELVPGAFQLLDLLTLQVFLFLLHQLFYIENGLMDCLEGQNYAMQLNMGKRDYCYQLPLL
jgi:hypothetical protein